MMNLGVLSKKTLIVSCLLLFSYFSGFFTLLIPLASFALASWIGLKNASKLGVVFCLFIVAAFSLFLPEQFSDVGNFVLPGFLLLEHFSRFSVFLLGLFYFIFFFSAGLILFQSLQKSGDLNTWFLSSFVKLLLLLALFFVLFVSLSPDSLYNSSVQHLESLLAKIEAAESASSSGAAMSQLFGNKHEFSVQFLHYFPALFAIFCLFTLVVNTLLSRRLFKHLPAFACIKPFSAFRLPDQFIWLLIISGLAFFAGKYIVGATFLEIVALNLAITAFALYVLQGLAVALFFITRVNSVFLRTAAMIMLVIFFVQVSLFLFLIGIFDVWLNIRERKVNTKQNL